MRISAKGRYGLAVMSSMAKDDGPDKLVTVVSLSERLGISKIYLEQVFTLLKRGGVVVSVKGANGGYRLVRAPKDISVYDVLAASEVGVFEKTGVAVGKNDEALEQALRVNVFDVLDNAVRDVLMGISLEDVVSGIGDNYMYYL